MTPYNHRRRNKNYDIIFEFIPQGRYVKVSAVDIKTGTETCIVADRRTRIEPLKTMATKKLSYVMSKNCQE